MMPITPIGKQRSLRLEQSQPHISQRFAVLLFSSFTWHEIHLGPLAGGALPFRIKSLPFLVGPLPQCRRQFLALDRTDGKSNPSTGFLGSVRMFEPPDQ